MSALNMSAMQEGVSRVSSPKSGLTGRAQPEDTASAALFAALHAERVGAASATVEVPRTGSVKPLAADRSFSVGDLILNTMDRMPERAGPLEASTPSSASVFLKFQKGYGVESVVVPVRALVANGIPGLSQDRVAVVMVPAAGQEVAGQSASLSKVLFMRVDRESVTPLWVLLGLLGAVLLVGAAWGVRFLIRLRQDGFAL